MAKRSGKSKAKKRIVQWREADGSRKTIWLGACDKDDFAEKCVKIKALIAAKRSGRIGLHPEVANWIKTLDARFARKLSAVGLIPECESVSLPRSIGAFLDFALAQRKRLLDSGKIAARTYDNARQDVVSMIAYFGRSLSLERITPGRVDEYVVWLQTEGRAGRRKTLNTDKKNVCGYSDATIARRLKRCRQFLRLAVRNGLIADNPFTGVGKGFRQTSPEPNREVTRDEFDRIIKQCPDTQWEAIIALSRIGGLRCPSESLAITWADVDFEGSKFMPPAPTLRVPSQKTDCHGRPFRIIPLWPELRQILADAKHVAGGDEVSPDQYVITRNRDRTQNLRTQLGRIIKRAGLSVWKKPFHAMRSSRQNELTRKFPLHLVCEWMGNSIAVARDHYLSANPGDYVSALTEKSAAKSAASTRRQRPSSSIKLVDSAQRKA